MVLYQTKKFLHSRENNQQSKKQLINFKKFEIIYLISRLGSLQNISEPPTMQYQNNNNNNNNNLIESDHRST